jgi:hypothetical protein
MKTYLKGLITQNSLPPLVHDATLWGIFLVALLLFRGQLRALLDRLLSHESGLFGKNKFAPNPALSKFPESETISSDSSSAIRPTDAPKAPLDFYKSAHFYWLGSDMETAIRSVVNMPDKELTIRALTQALWHFRNTGLKDTDIEQRIRWLINLNEKTLISTWVTDSSRRDILNEVLIAKSKIDRLVQREAGTGFKAFEN